MVCYDMMFCHNKHTHTHMHVLFIFLMPISWREKTSCKYIRILTHEWINSLLLRWDKIVKIQEGKKRRDVPAAVRTQWKWHCCVSVLGEKEKKIKVKQWCWGLCCWGISSTRSWVRLLSHQSCAQATCTLTGNRRNTTDKEYEITHTRLTSSLSLSCVLFFFF